MRKLPLLLVACSMMSNVSRAQAASRCDEDFMEEYLARKNCVGGLSIPQEQGKDRDKLKAQEEGQACIQLGFLELQKGRQDQTGGLALVGAAGGGAAGNLLHKYFAGEGEEALKKSQRFLAEIEIEKAKYKKVQEKRNAIQDEVTKKMTNGKFQSYAELSREWQDMGTQNKNNSLLLDVDKELKARFAQEAKASVGSDGHEYWKLLANGEMTRKDFPILKKFNEIYADEHRAIQKHYDAIQAVRDQYQGRQLFHWGKIEYSNKMKAARNALDKFLETAPPNVKIADAIRSHGMNSIGSGVNGLGFYGQELAIIKANAEETEVRRNRLHWDNVKAKAAGGVLGAVAMVAAEGAGPIVMGQTDLKSCQSELKLTPAEMEYLSFKDVKVAERDGSVNVPYVRSSAICKTMEFNDPAKIYRDHFFKGGVPEGLCQIMQNENSRLKKIEGEPSEKTKISCDSYSDENTEIDVAKKTFTFRQPGYTLKTNLVPGLSWPNFQKAEVTTPDGKADPRRQVDFVTAFNREYPASLMKENMDVIQKMRGCDHNGAVNCELLKASVKSQVAMNIRGHLCSGGSKSKGSGSEKAPAEKKSSGEGQKGAI